MISPFSNLIDDSAEYRTVPSGSNWRIDSAVTDLPDPDSPTKDNVLPFSMVKEISSTALKIESFDSKSMTKLLIYNILSTLLYRKFKIYRIFIIDIKRTV